ncbi:MAG: hypothetical protein OEY38_21890 [Gammaproteobacteria bacterium]|nr:hypothetical protein [Gammaproteobacteria bacterium]
MLAGALGGGLLVNLFLGNKAPAVAFNIRSTDWVTFTQAVHAIPTIKKRLIEDEALYQLLDYFSDPKQKLFWEGVVSGCAIH